MKTKNATTLKQGEDVMAGIKKTYSHSPVNLPDEPQRPDRNITVLDGNFEKVIARVYQTDKDDALENAQMIVNALNLAKRLEGLEEEIDFVDPTW